MQCRTSPPQRAYARGKRGLVIGDLGTVTLALAIGSAIRGLDVRFLSTRFRHPTIIRLLERLQISPISLEMQDRIPLEDKSYDTPLFAAHEYIESLNIEQVLAHLASRYPGVEYARSALRVALVKAMTPQALGTFIQNSWIRSVGYDSATIFARSRDEAQVLKFMKTPARVLWTPQPNRVLKRVGSFLQRAGDGFGSKVWPPKGRAVSCEQGAADAGSARQMASVVMVFNRGDHYGRLYAYDHLFDQNCESPLHRSNTAYLSRDGGALEGGGIAAQFPIGGSWTDRRFRAFRIYLSCRAFANPSVPRRVLWNLALICAQVEGSARELRALFPGARVACLLFEIQVPPYLSLAFDVAGIRTVALHERPETAFEHASPMIVNTILSASPFLSEALTESWSVAIREAEPVGMWRTDILLAERGSTWPAEHDPPQVDGRQLIVALPYHVVKSASGPIDPIGTSAQTMEHFLGDMIMIAAERPECFVLVRAKNMDWVCDPQLASVVAAIDAQDNMAISRTYDRLNESYRLVAHAHLVIGKATSLIDECLALGIPCLLHDYTGNTRGSRMSILHYLPRELWVLDRGELESGVRFALQGGDAFNTWWEPHRKRIYGDLNDGMVRLRARSVIRKILGESEVSKAR
ncbi:MAG: hypothetical protein JW395_4175 [Nitrospira sp.]|nr:hypothetical protein [Nitrospira sp.]